MKKNKTNIILIISTICLIFSVGCLVFLFNIVKNKNIHTSTVLDTLEKKIKEKENIGVLNSKMKELEEYQNKIDSFVVNVSKVDTFVEYLENLGLNNNVDLVVKSVDSPKNEKNKIVVTVSMTGGFSDIMKGISSLEYSSYNIVINTIYLNKEFSKTTEIDTIDSKETPKPRESFWIANVSFNVLSM